MTKHLALPIDAHCCEALNSLDPSHRVGLNDCLHACQTLGEFWDRASRAEWLLILVRVLGPQMTRRADDRDLRLFACWCAEQIGEADPIVKLVVRGDLKPSCLERRFGRLWGTTTGPTIHGAVRRAARAMTTAYGAHPDALEAAFGAAHALAMYHGTRPFPVAQQLRIRADRIVRDPGTASENRTAMVGAGQATAIEQTVADAVRAFLGNPFVGTAPTATAREVGALLRIRPPVPAPAPAPRPRPAIVSRRPARGRGQNRILLTENHGWADEEVVLVRTRRHTFRLDWISYGDEEGPTRWVGFRSGPLRSGEDFICAMEQLAEEVHGRWDLYSHFDEMVAVVYQLDDEYGQQVEQARTAKAEAEFEQGLVDSIPRLLEDLVAYGAGDPERWGITQSGFVEPLALAQGLSLAELVRASGKTVGRRTRVPDEWIPHVRRWLLDQSA